MSISIELQHEELSGSGLGVCKWLIWLGRFFAKKCDCPGQPPRESAAIEAMATVYMSESDVARDLHAVLVKVKQGIEVVIEQDHRPVAVLKAQQRSGRPGTEILAEAQRRNSAVTLDSDFGNDMNEVIASHQRAWNPPSWD